MNTQSVAAPIHASIVVEAPIDHAFEVFTAGIGSWWPEKNHILQAELAEMVFEPKVGGHIYDVGTDGSESRWARVLAYEPPDRARLQLGHHHRLAARDRSRAHQRGRGPLQRRIAAAHAGRA